MLKKKAIYFYWYACSCFIFYWYVLVDPYIWKLAFCVGIEEQENFCIYPCLASCQQCYDQLSDNYA